MFSRGTERKQWHEMDYGFPFSSPITLANENASKQVLLWRYGVLVITTEKFHFIKSEFRFCPGSDPGLGVLEVCEGKNL